MLSILKTILQHKEQDNRLFVLNQFQQWEDKLGQKVFIKLYLEMLWHTYLSLLLESSSDISLIHKKELKKLITSEEINKYKFENQHTMETFSNHVINILNNVTLPSSFKYMNWL